jgi:hypothetical protein
MTKRAGKISKRLIIIVVSLFTVVGLGVAGYFVYVRQQPEQKKATETAKQKAEGYNITGDADLATRYVALLEAGKSADARKLFDDQVAKESTADAKLTLLTQQVQLALADTKPDEALYAAEQAIIVRADDTTYAQAAAASVAKHDTAQQIAYLEKAIAYLTTSDRPDKSAALAYYQQQITSAKRQLEGVK